MLCAAEDRLTEKANERAAADLEAIVDAMPSDGCLLMDVLATLRDRWGVKDSQARERIASALPIGVEVSVGAYLFKADRTRRDERAPIELRRRARSG
ncbi:hypothetical protein ACW7BJ_33845 [Azospirillum argentinense]